MAAVEELGELPQLEDEGMAEKEDGAVGEVEEGSTEFSKVRRKRKRRARDMEVESSATGDDREMEEERGTAVKRPSFPPVDASTTLVSSIGH